MSWVESTIYSEFYFRWTMGYPHEKVGGQALHFDLRLGNLARRGGATPRTRKTGSGYPTKKTEPSQTRPRQAKEFPTT